jgi:hypothetical protein
MGIGERKPEYYAKSRNLAYMCAVHPPQAVRSQTLARIVHEPQVLLVPGSLFELGQDVSPHGNHNGKG